MEKNYNMPLLKSCQKEHNLDHLCKW